MKKNKSLNDDMKDEWFGYDGDGNLVTANIYGFEHENNSTLFLGRLRDVGIFAIKVSFPVMVLLEAG